jgi:hypothetical protein
MREKLVQWVITSQQPFTVVEEPSFIEFVHTLHPGVLLPSADTVKRNIYDLYEENVGKIKNILQMVPGKISFTTDIWTSPSTKSFLSLTAHFIDKDWKLQSVIIDFIQMYGSHTGENIKNTFISGLENLSIKNKVINIFLYFKLINILIVFINFCSCLELLLIMLQIIKYLSMN